jgi:lysozyme
LIPGIDVSKWQGQIDWHRVSTTGVRFCFIKATEGTGHTDPSFVFNWQSARDAGILRGAYHYFHPRQDARVQAHALFQSLAGDLGELPPALDVESAELTGSPLLASLSVFLNEWQDLSGRPALIYTSPGFWNSYATPYPPEWPARHSLWVAHYGVGRPTIPYPWLNFSFWQFTDRGEVAGITRFPARRPKVDLNWFNGSQNELEALQISQVITNRNPNTLQ